MRLLADRTASYRATAALAMMVLVGGVTGVSTQARPGVQSGNAAAPIASSETGIRFTSKTVAIPSSTVHHYLIGVSKIGVFKFKRAAGALARLKPGKVMFLKGSDALLVTRISHSGHQLLVSTKPASLPQLIKAGKIKFSGKPNFDHAFAGPIIVSGSKAAARAFMHPAYPYVGMAPAGTISVQGSSGHFGYSLSFTPAVNKLNVSGVICFQWGSICGNGPSNGLSLEVNISGYIDVGKDAASIAVNGGRITNSSVSLTDLHAHLKLIYTAARGTGSDHGGDPPVFRLPIGIDYTVPGLLPIYVKVQTAVLIKLGLSSKNSVLRGGVRYDSTGSDTVVDSGSKESGSGSGKGPKGEILDNGDGGTGPTVALGAGGVVLAVEFPKIGVGLGIRAVNVIGYLDMITALGQTAAGAVAGGGCTYDLDWSAGGGFQAQAGPFGLSTPRKILIPRDGKQFERHFNAPSC
jgi:hypothetical protein